MWKDVEGCGRMWKDVAGWMLDGQMEFDTFPRGIMGISTKLCGFTVKIWASYGKPGFNDQK